MHVARRFDKREIVRVWERGALVAEEFRCFRPSGTPPPVVIVGVRCWRCFPPELPPLSRGMGVAGTEVVAFLVFCNSHCLMVFAMLGWERYCLVLGWVRFAWLIGRKKKEKKEIPYMEGILRASGPLWVCSSIWECGYLL